MGFFKKVSIEVSIEKGWRKREKKRKKVLDKCGEKEYNIERPLFKRQERWVINETARKTV